MIDLFPNGYNIEVTRSEKSGKSYISIVIYNKDDNIPFIIYSPDEELSSSSIIESISELKQSLEKVKTNKEEWFTMVREKVEKEEEEKARKASTRKESSKTKSKDETEHEKEELKQIAEVPESENNEEISIEKENTDSSNKITKKENKDEDFLKLGSWG